MNNINNKLYHNMPLLDESLYDLHHKINNSEIYNILQMIKYWADKQPNKIAYHWIEKSDGKVTKSYTYGELWKEIESVKYHLENEWKVKKGDCVFIVYPPGLEFIFAFFGCMLAGCVAVPVYPPVPGRTLKKGVDKLKLLHESCHAKVALTSNSYNVGRRTSKVISFKAKWPKDLKWYITDNIKWKPKYAVKMNEINIDENAVAFLQYTSGSTGDPKGVMILHKNIFQNILVAIHHVALKGSNTIGMCWVPQYHDMGLIGCYTSVICSGSTQYAMSPFTFLQQPSLWIHCLSKYKCEVTSAPNFAFELAVRKWHTPKDGHNIDLSHLMVLGSGGEPIRLDTVNKFYKLFTKYGLNRGVIHPVFGIAESCLYVTFARNILTHTDHRGIQRVCSGNVDVVKFKFGVDIRIINSETGEEVKDEEEGEIIISSQSIAAGYMNRPQLSKETFQFQLPNNNNNNNNSEDKYYLKTGDLGMIVKPDREWSIAHPDRHPTHGQNDELLEEELNQRHLVITGRIKDLIILNGRNYYPQDIELCVEHALTNKRLVRSGCVVATSIEWNNEESFAVVCELRKDVLAQHIKDEKKKDKKLTKELVLKHICIEMIKAIHSEFGAKPCVVALIKEKTIPKTTSGKVRRKATATALLSIDKSTQLKLIHQYEDDLKDTMSKLQMEANIKHSSIKILNDTLQSENHVMKLNDIKENIRFILNDILMFDSAVNDQDNKNNEGDEDETSQFVYDESQSFNEMGLASMDLVNFSDKIEEMFNIEFDASLLYNYSTPAHLSEYIFVKKSGCKILLRAPKLIRQNSIVNNMEKLELAIVGMSCRVPGDVNNPSLFWKALMKGDDLVKHSVMTGRHNITSVGAGLSQSVIESFDNKVFGITKAEANLMDPQQRLLLTTTFETMYNCGYESLESINDSSIGVFIGIAGSEHEQLQINALSATSVASSIASNRISYTFGLTGPSMSIDTACSSVLVCIRTAILSIQSGDCDSAIVGGVNVIQSETVTESFKEMGVLSSTSSCKSFDFEADGYVRSEGCGTILIMKLDEAKERNLNVLSIIRGSSINQNGHGMSLTAPNGNMQKETIINALNDANLHADDIDIIEAHGTATALGDTIELNAIKDAIVTSTRVNDLLLTTAKPTVGHCEAASGIISIIKSILQLSNKLIPANITFTSSKNKLDKIIIPQKNYKLENRTSYCGVNSFGFGGTNAHIILEGLKDSQKYMHKDFEWNYDQFNNKSNKQKSIRNVIYNRESIDELDSKLDTIIYDLDDISTIVHETILQYITEPDEHKVDTSKSLSDLGIDSLQFGLFAANLGDNLGINISIQTLMECKSIDELITNVSLQINGNTYESDNNYCDKNHRKTTIDIYNDLVESNVPNYAYMRRDLGTPLNIPWRYFLQICCLLLSTMVLSISAIPPWRMLKWCLENGYDDSILIGFRLWDNTKIDKPYHMLGFLTTLAVPVWFTCYTLSVVILKWLIIGRYKADIYRLHSLKYYRWFLMDTIINIWEIFFFSVLKKSILLTVFYKLMGANIPWSLRTSSCIREYDLFYMHGNSSLPSGRNIFNRLLTVDYIWFDEVHIFDNLNVGTSVIILPGSIIEDNVKLLNSSVVLSGTIVKANGVYEGNPINHVAFNPSNTQFKHNNDTYSIIRMDLIKLLSIYALIWLLNVYSVPMTILLEFYPLPKFRYGNLAYHLLRILSVYTFIIIMLPLYKWILYGRVKAGITYKESTFTEWRRWIMELQYLIWNMFLGRFTDFTSFLNLVWIACGGKNMLNLMHVVYDIPFDQIELLEIPNNAKCFMSVVSSLELDREVEPGLRQRSKLIMHDRSKIGARSIIQDGILEEDSMVSNLTTFKSGTCLKAGQTLIGSPAKVINFVDKTVTNVTKKRTATNIYLDLVKIFIEMLFIVLLICIFSASLIAPYEFGRYISNEFDASTDILILAIGLEIWFYVISFLLIGSLLKRLFMWRLQPFETDAFDIKWTWSAFKLIESIMIGNASVFLHATFIKNLFTQLDGSQIDINALLFAYNIQDTHLIKIGNGSVLDVGSSCIGHYLAKKFVQDYTVIGENVVCQPHVDNLGRTIVESNTVIGAQSTMFVGQSATSGYHWQGNPAISLKKLPTKNVTTPKNTSSKSARQDIKLQLNPLKL